MNLAFSILLELSPWLGTVILQEYESSESSRLGNIDVIFLAL